MLWLLFFNIFYCHFSTTNAPVQNKIKPNRSFEKFDLNNLLQKFLKSRPKSKSPSSRFSNTARTNSHRSPAFHTPNASPISTIIVSTIILSEKINFQHSGTKINVDNTTKTIQETTIPKNDSWDNVKPEFDEYDLRNDCNAHFATPELKKYQQQGIFNKYSLRQYLKLKKYFMNLKMNCINV